MTMKRYDISEHTDGLLESHKGEYCKVEDVVKLLEQIASHTDIPPKAAVIKHIDEVL